MKTGAVSHNTPYLTWLLQFTFIFVKMNNSFLQASHLLMLYGSMELGLLR